MKNLLLTVALSTCAIQPAAAVTKADICQTEADFIATTYETRLLGFTATRIVRELRQRIPTDRMDSVRSWVAAAYDFPANMNPLDVWDVSYAACMSESM